MIPLVLGAACLLWLTHASAWDLGGRSPLLNYDTAQVAVAARELAQHGRLVTPYALPIELSPHAHGAAAPGAPWPLAVVQPGLVLLQAAVFKLVPPVGGFAGSDARSALTLLVPFAAFLMLIGSFALGVRHLIEQHAPGFSAPRRRMAMVLVALAAALDPEAQHFAAGAFTEIPFTLGLLMAMLGLALGRAASAPLVFGLLLGLTGLFRANMLWLAPVFALAAAWSAEPGRRARVLAGITVGFVIPLAPWWFYKWRTFGDPGWDLTRYVVWDGVGGRTWFSLYHLPELPQVPHGFEAVRLLLAKFAKNAPELLLAMTTGPRGLLLGALAVVACTPGPRPIRAAACAGLAASALALATTAISIPWLRYLFPTRLVVEAMGLLALWTLVERIAPAMVGPRGRRLLQAAAAVLVIGWGVFNTVRGNAEARAVSAERGVPSSRTLKEISGFVRDQIPDGETVMSNLGPALSWYADRAVVHLALTPEDVYACRRRHAFRHILLVFRESHDAWPGWSEVLAREGAAATVEGLRVVNETRAVSRDGFTVVWLELGALPGALASVQSPTRPTNRARPRAL